MKITEQYFGVVLFIMMYKVVLAFESVNEILKCDHSNELSYWAALSSGSVRLYKMVYYMFEFVDEIIKTFFLLFN